VALGNGHWTQEARKLVSEASDACSVDTDIRLVSKAGASVWSVTEAANEEFPNESAAAIAAVLIGRRYLNPMAELVKIPPWSLGLGMYQHDLTKKDLDEKLHITSVGAVAEVGIEANSCSAEILEKVPGFKTKVQYGRILAARPLFESVPTYWISQDSVQRRLKIVQPSFEWTERTNWIDNQ
jgi:uncharacterized protein